MKVLSYIILLFIASFVTGNQEQHENETSGSDGVSATEQNLNDSVTVISYGNRRAKSAKPSRSSVKDIQISDKFKSKSEKSGANKPDKASIKSINSSKRFYKERPVFVVKYKSKSGKMRANNRMKSRKGTNTTTSSRFIEDLDRYDVQIVEIDTYDELQAFEEDEDVEFVEEDRRRYILQHTNIAARNLAEFTPYGIKLVRALDVSDKYISNRQVCIIDTGYDITHQDLPKPTATGTNGVNGMLWYKDEYSGHGTHVAGTIAAVGNNDKGVIGINRNNRINLHIVRVFGEGGNWISGTSLVKAVEQCRDAGSNIVSMSLGGGGFSSFEFNAYTKIFEEDGVMLVAAAGNDGDSSFSYPASYTPVISVAAIDANKKLAYFSQRNSQVDLAAPGVDVRSTFPGNRYEYISGTSMSTPHVSGVAALVWSHFPNLTAKRIRGVLENTAEDLGTVGRDDMFGHGLIRADLAYKQLLDSTVSNPTTDCPYPTTKIIIKTDMHPSQTTWTLIDVATGHTIKTEGTYGLPLYQYVSTLCLVPGQYQITINDSGGNGLCCTAGKGFYRVLNDGEKLLGGRSFQYTVSRRFSVALKPSASPSTSFMPTSLPSISPSYIPSSSPSHQPSSYPSVSQMPSNVPSDIPSVVPSNFPSYQPSSYPSVTQMPSNIPSNIPSVVPSISIVPSIAPSDQPSNVPSVSSHPSIKSSLIPSLQPSPQPTSQPKPICPNHRHMHVEFFLKSDSNSNENKIFLKNLTRSKIVWRVRNIPSNTTVSYGKCVPKRNCYQVILRDSAGDGLYDGLFSASVNGVLLKSTTFPKGKHWRSPRFGQC
jgi:serine protease